MELRRPVKPLVPVAMRVRFPPSAPNNSTHSGNQLPGSTLPACPASGLRRLCGWEHGVTGNMLVSKTRDGGSTPRAPASMRFAEGSPNGMAPVPKTGGLVL